MSSEYDLPRSGALKLKKLNSTIKKKKKKSVNAEQRKDPQTKGSTTNDSYKETPEDVEDLEAAMRAKMRERNPLLHKTKAELKTLQMQEKLKEKRLLDKASKTHKMRVEDFNRHLDSLTEHFDIPKVSWTK